MAVDLARHKLLHRVADVRGTQPVRYLFSHGAILPHFPVLLTTPKRPPPMGGLSFGKHQQKARIFR